LAGTSLKANVHEVDVGAAEGVEAVVGLASVEVATADAVRVGEVVGVGVLGGGVPDAGVNEGVLDTRGAGVDVGVSAVATGVRVMLGVPIGVPIGVPVGIGVPVLIGVPVPEGMGVSVLVPVGVGVAHPL
jgi:hypothetical protein